MTGAQLAHAGVAVADVLAFVVVVVIGLVLARHQPRNPIGWLLLSLLVLVAGFMATQAVGSANIHSHPWLAIDFEVVTQLLYYCFLFTAPLVLLFFPDGHLPSPVWRKVLVAYAACALAMMSAVVISVLAPVWGEHHPNIGPNGVIVHPGPVMTTVLVVLSLSCLALALSWVVTRVRSYRRSSGAVRQQYRWLSLGAACLLVSLIVSTITTSGNSVTADIENAVTAVAAIPFPLTIGIAILKYRLYDIDRIISRTLSYALITAVLVGTYVGCIALTTQLMPFSSAVGVAASTLAAVALFTPLRRRMQRVVDHRFNRTRYDAEVTLAAFSASLRDAIDLERIQRELVDVVHHVIEPSQVSVWLRSEV